MKDKEIVVQTASKSYSVYIGDNGIWAIQYFCQLKQNRKNPILIITDTNIPKDYVDSVSQTLKLDGFPLFIYKVPAGESAKQMDIYQECLTQCIVNGLNRQSMIIALGGGVVGDLAGFVAATYLRGIRFVQMPTTILAHDSAIGGKVAINHPLGKNLIGCFYQPDAVIFHMPFFRSLPERELRSGFAEMVKEALIADATLLNQLMDNVKTMDDIFTPDFDKWFCKAISIKSNIVSKDERESGIRAYLNFGHTLGHAIEGAQELDYRSHGECVAIGLLFALKLSIELTGLKFDYQSFQQWLKNLGYNGLNQNDFTTKELMEFLMRDKKVKDGTVKFILLTKIGKPTMKELEFDYLEEKIGEFLHEVGF